MATAINALTTAWRSLPICLTLRAYGGVALIEHMPEYGSQRSFEHRNGIGLTTT
jgi:hypothetical protein